MKNIGIKVNGAFFKLDRGTLTWDELINMIEANGIHYTGQSVWIDDEGNIVDGIFDKNNNK